MVYDKNFEKERKNEDAFENESGVTKVKKLFCDFSSELYKGKFTFRF